MAYLLYNHGSYYGIFTHAGRKHWVRIGRIDKQNARKILRQLEVEYAKDRLNLKEVKPITLFGFLDKYLDYTKANKAQSTHKRELQILNHIREHFDNIFLRKITNQMIEGYKSKRLKDDVSKSGVNRELAVVSNMLRKAVDLQYIKDSPFKGISLLKKKLTL
jgi:integrase-like protein